MSNSQKIKQYAESIALVEMPKLDESFSTFETAMIEAEKDFIYILNELGNKAKDAENA